MRQHHAISPAVSVHCQDLEAILRCGSIVCVDIVSRRKELLQRPIPPRKLALPLSPTATVCVVGRLNRVSMQLCISAVAAQKMLEHDYVKHSGAAGRPPTLRPDPKYFSSRYVGEAKTAIHKALKLYHSLELNRSNYGKRADEANKPAPRECMGSSQNGSSAQSS